MISSSFSYLLDIFSGIITLRSAKNEDALTNLVAKKLSALTAEGKLNAVWFHVPNETVVSGSKDFLRLRKKKALGLIPGAPDFVLVSNENAVFLELKTKKGRLSPAQEKFKKWCELLSVKYYVARSVDDLVIVLQTEGFVK